MFALFAAVQLADGVMTYTAVVQFGPHAEGNPLLAFFITTCGAAATLVAAKLVALGLALVLYARMRYATLAALTAGYVFAALGPWAWTAF